MPVRTEESLHKLFAESRARQQRLKEEETKKYRKAQESTKKALADKLSIKQEKTPQKAQKQQITVISRTMHIYNSRYIERFADENELYTTREQLKQAEERGEGKIKWDKFNELVEQTKQMLQNEIYLCKD